MAAGRDETGENADDGNNNQYFHQSEAGRPPAHSLPASQPVALLAGKQPVAIPSLTFLSRCVHGYFSSLRPNYGQHGLTAFEVSGTTNGVRCRSPGLRTMRRPYGVGITNIVPPGTRALSLIGLFIVHSYHLGGIVPWTALRRHFERIHSSLTADLRTRNCEHSRRTGHPLPGLLISFKDQANFDAA